MPEHHARRLVLRMEEVELAPKLSMVALLGFLEAVQVRVLILLLRPGGAVDPLQHLVLRIAAPVRAGELHQLEDAQLAGGGHVRPAAKVRELAFGVKRDRLVGWNRRDDFGLVVLADGFEIRDRVVARHELARHRLVFFGELGHLRLDGAEVLRRERALEREVVVEAVLDHRTDRHLRVGEQFLYRVREQVRRRVADDFQTLGILLGNDGHRGVAVDHFGGVDELAVDLGGERGLGEAGADRRCDLVGRNRAVVAADRPVGQCNGRHIQTPENKKVRSRPHFYRQQRTRELELGRYPGVKRVRGVITWPFLSLLPVDPDVW